MFGLEAYLLLLAWGGGVIRREAKRGWGLNRGNTVSAVTKIFTVQ